MIGVVALLQAAATAAPPLRLDLLSVTPPRCPTPANGDIVVCSRPRDDYRLQPLPEAPAAGPKDPLATALPGGGQARLHAIHSSLPGGEGNGLAVTATIPLGRGRKRD